MSYCTRCYHFQAFPYGCDVVGGLKMDLRPIQIHTPIADKISRILYSDIVHRRYCSIYFSLASIWKRRGYYRITLQPEARRIF